MKSESFIYGQKKLKEVVNHKPTINEQIEYIRENRISLAKLLDEAPDITKASYTIEMLRAIEESLGEVKLLAIG